MIKKFTKTVEDFTCIVCGKKIKGTGFTNHCPHCLHSVHVDINPGDRQCSCHGVMKPIGLDTKKGERMIIHECTKCGFIRRNKVSEEDDFKALLSLSQNSFPKK